MVDIYMLIYLFGGVVVGYLIAQIDDEEPERHLIRQLTGLSWDETLLRTWLREVTSSLTEDTFISIECRHRSSYNRQTTWTKREGRVSSVITMARLLDTSEYIDRVLLYRVPLPTSTPTLDDTEQRIIAELRQVDSRRELS